jgi:hypothetical protein
LLGEYELFQSQYSNDPGAMAVWFNYESYLIGQPNLECHRVQQAGTAFTDDQGQVYHGFLDMHGRTVAVYLPGYDHSAHEMRCILRWMPRKPAAPSPVSRPMVFKIVLPRYPRVLPPASSLPRTVTAQKDGITVTVEAARLSGAKQTKDTVWRDLTFHLKIDGGYLTNDNAVNDLSSGSPYAGSGGSTRIAINGRAAISAMGLRSLTINPAAGTRQRLSFYNSFYSLPMTFTDPYGFPLLTGGQPITPLISADIIKSFHRGEGAVWVARVSSAGKGTDAVRLHLDVAPKPRIDAHGTLISPVPVPFELTIPIQTGDEI